MFVYDPNCYGSLIHGFDYLNGHVEDTVKHVSVIGRGGGGI